jgi:DNA primase
VGLHARGIRNVVAPLGTAFTLEQGKHIGRFSNRLTLLFDGDAAGKKAARASRGPARDAGLRAQVAQLPDGMDPDDFIRQRGADGLTHLLSGAKGMLDYLIAEVLDESFQTMDAVGQAKKIEEVVELLKSEEDPNVSALAEQYADKLAGRLGVADAHTFRALRNNVRKKLTVRSEHTPEHIQQVADRAKTSSQTGDLRGVAVGDSILGVFLDFPELLQTEGLEDHLTHVQGDLAAAIACLQAAISRGSKGTDLVHSLERLPRNLAAFAIQRLAAPKHDDIDVARVELFANFDKLGRMELSRLASGTRDEIERARNEGDFDQELELLKQQELRARKRHGL